MPTTNSSCSAEVPVLAPLGSVIHVGGTVRTGAHLALMVASLPLRSMAVVRSTFDDRRGNGDDRTRGATGTRYSRLDDRL